MSWNIILSFLLQCTNKLLTKCIINVFIIIIIIKLNNCK